MKCSKSMCVLLIVIFLFLYSWKWLSDKYSLSNYQLKGNHYFMYVTETNSVSQHIGRQIFSPSVTSIVSKKYSQPCMECIVLAVVSCGERYAGTVNVIKSAIALSMRPLIIELFTEAELIPKFSLLHMSWPEDIQQRVILNVHEASFPADVEDKAWRNLFKKCAAIRLFLSALLLHIDSAIYVDTDILFLAPVEKIWQHFAMMNASQMVAMTQEHEDPATGWYNRFAKHPFYGKLGVNSGVMLMNLTRLRKFDWVHYLSPILKEFRKSITWGDQDIINIIFHFHPDKLYLLDCEYNYRPDHCMYMSVCKSANSNGVYALHGNRGVFYNDKQPLFKAIYHAWNKYNLGEDLRQNLYYPMQKNLIQSDKSNCGKLYRVFLKNLETMIKL